MNINVSQISRDEGLTVEHLYPEGEPPLENDDARLEGRPVLKLHATREGKKVNLVGNISATVRIECDRCLTAISIPVDQSFDLLYLSTSGPEISQEEKALADQDLSVAYYSDQTIDLDELSREQIELALPMGKLCSEQCRGLCSDCGANLNTAQCDCNSEPVDPRWNALKEFKH